MQKGFTIIELVIAIFILSIAVIGAFSAFTIMDILTNNSADRFISAYLAQEGIEIVRNIRDNNFLNLETEVGRTWTTGLDGCVYGCEADFKTFGDAESPLYQWTGDGNNLCFENHFYTLNPSCPSENQTKFRRKITITPLQTRDDSWDVIKVSVTVYWIEKSNILHSGDEDQSITVEEYLYNWY